LARQKAQSSWNSSPPPGQWIAASASDSRKELDGRIQQVTLTTVNNKDVREQKRRFSMLNILNTTAANIAWSLGLAAMGCLPRRQALHFGRLLLRKFPEHELK
jgi:hypothetical protein